MVISDTHKYIYVELPLTGSTAVSQELCELYEGKKILKKHARYHEFLKTASPEKQKYFCFSNQRNPMDAIVSEFLKIKNNHKGRYTNPKEWKENGGTILKEKRILYDKIQKTNMTFEQYFKKYFKLPYDNWSSLDHEKFDFIIRFENIQNDFGEALKRLNIQSKRELPQINKTSFKEDYWKYYTPEIQKRALFVFGPFLKKWGYEFPGEWHSNGPGTLSLFLFSILGSIRKIYWKNKASRSTPASSLEKQSH